MRHAGVGFPNGPVSNAAVFALPSPDLLMLSTEGRYHHDAAVRAGKRVLWRAVPRIGKRPAELGWSPSRFVAETINLTDAPTLPISDFVWANELDLQDERGDRDDDWSGLSNRYSLIGGWALSVVQSLKQWSPGTRIHWPAWTPDHHALDYVYLWYEAARSCDVIDFHAYDSLDQIQRAYYAYRNEFTDRPLALTEWHCKGDVDEERRVLAWLAETMVADPLFEAAYFFIWRWHNPASWWDDAWDIEHSPDRLRLFMDPPTAEPIPEPEPEPEPMPPELPRGIDVASYQGYPDWEQVAGLGYDFAFTKLTEDTGYQNPTFSYNWENIKRVGMARGCYHFARPEGNDAVTEADYFVDLLEPHGIETGDMLALDLEAGFGDLGPWALTFLRRVEERVGFKPIVYTGRWFSDPHNLPAYPEIGEFGLWLAAYQAVMPAPPAPWPVVAFWQFSSSGQVPGIVGDVDLNVFVGTLEAMALYGKPADVEPEPGPDPEPEYAVGPGILDAMTAHGDQPATDEFGHEVYAEAWGASGAHYVYVKSLNRTFRYDPAA